MSKLSAAAAMLGICGCSFIGVRGPADDAARHPPAQTHCTDSYGWVVADALGAAAALALVGSVVWWGGFSHPANDETDHPPVSQLLLTLVPVVIIYGTALGYGADNVHACRKAKDAAQAAQAGHEAAGSGR